MTEDYNDELIGSVAEDTTLPDAPDWVTVHASQTRMQVFWDSLTEGDSGSYDPSPDWESYVGDDWDEIVRQHAGTIAADLSFVPVTAAQSEDILGFDVETDEEIAYFQVQVATDASFQNVIRHDRMVKGHVRTWRISKPSSAVFYARVRSVDLFGNKSAWRSSSDYNKFPYQPYPPNVRMKKQSNDNYQANVNYLNDSTLSPGLDETISRFQFASREMEFARLNGHVAAADATFTVTSASVDSNEVPAVPFTVYVNDEQMTVTSITGALSLVWHVTRGINSTTAAAHTDGTKVFYFGKGSSSSIQHVILDDDLVRTTVAYRGLDPGSRWKFKVRVIDAQNRKSFWSNWTPVIQAATGASYDNGDVPGGTGETGDPGTDPVPPVVDPPAPVEDPGTVDPIETAWPHERIIRFEMDVSDTFVSAAVTGFDAIATSARATVDAAPSPTVASTSKTETYIPSNPADTAVGLPPLDESGYFTRQQTDVPGSTPATVDVNLNGVSFLTLRIPADDPKNQSDLTWVTPPLRIGSQTGQLIAAADEITITQTDMQDASGTLTVYLMIYLA